MGKFSRTIRSASLALLLLASPALAQFDVNSGGTGCDGVKVVVDLTGSFDTGAICTVTDGASATDCATGAGSTKVTCRHDGSDVWTAIGGGGGGSQNVFKTIDAPSGTDPVADDPDDTLTLLAGAGCTITGSAAADSITIDCAGTTLTEEEVEDMVGTMVTGNTETCIAVTYTDGGVGAGTLDFTVSVANACITDVAWSKITNFPSACAGGTFVTGISGTPTCTAVAWGDITSIPAGIADGDDTDACATGPEACQNEDAIFLRVEGESFVAGNCDPLTGQCKLYATPNLGSGTQSLINCELVPLADQGWYMRCPWEPDLYRVAWICPEGETLVGEECLILSTDQSLATHVANPSAHHARYTDSEALNAINSGPVVLGSDDTINGTVVNLGVSSSVNGQSICSANDFGCDTALDVQCSGPCIGPEEIDIYDDFYWEGNHIFYGTLTYDYLSLGENGHMELPRKTALPSTCNVGEVTLLDTADSGGWLHVCEAVDTWARVDSFSGEGGQMYGFADITGTMDFNESTTALILPRATTLPATCTTGSFYVDSDATSGQRLYLCESTNTWVLQGDGGGGGGNAWSTFALHSTSTGVPPVADSSGDTLTVGGGFDIFVAGGDDPESLQWAFRRSGRISDDWTLSNRACVQTDVNPGGTAPAGGFMCEAAGGDAFEHYYLLPGPVSETVDTTNYLALGAVDGDALAGDSATAFFDAGTLEDARVDGSVERDEVCGTTSLSATCEINTGVVGRSEIDETLLSMQTHATDCTLLTCDAGSDGEPCFEQDADTYYVCDGSGTPGWKQIAGGGAHGDGANCLAGEIPLGVDASGAVQSCYEPAFGDITGTATAGQLPALAGDVTGTVGLTALAADVVGTAEMADADHGDVSWSGGVATVDSGAVLLDEIGNPAASKTFTMANHSLTFNYTAPTAEGFSVEATGGFTGDLMHVHQHTGNPGAGTDLIHLEFADTDVTGIRLTGPSTSAAGITIAGGIIATDSQIQSTLATGTAPFTVASTTEVANLKSATATALAANGANCVTSTHFAVGVDASGAAECEAIGTADLPIITTALGGMGADISGYTAGLLGLSGGSAVDVDTIAEVNTALGSTLIREHYTHATDCPGTYATSCNAAGEEGNTCYDYDDERYFACDGSGWTAISAAATIADGSVTEPKMATADFGDWSCGAGAGDCTLDADVVAAAEMADADHGQVSWSDGVATVEDMTCTDCIDDTEIAINAGTALSADLEEETHASEHSVGGGDTITAMNLAAACTDAQVLGGNAGATQVECQTDDDVPEIGDLAAIDTEAEMMTLNTDSGLDNWFGDNEASGDFDLDNSQSECVWLPAGSITCLGTAGCTAPAQVDGTNFSYRVSEFATDADDTGTFTFLLPDNLVATTNVSVEVWWMSDNAACDNGADDDVCWVVATDTIASGAAWKTGAISTTAVGRTDRCVASGQLERATGLAVIAGWLAGQMAVVNVSRDVDGGTSACSGTGDDDYAQAAQLIGVQICYGVDNIFSGEQ